MSEVAQRHLADLRETIVLTRRDLDRLAERIRAAAERFDADVGQLEIYGAGALVHGYYTHLERLFERVVRLLNTGPSEGADWHRRLLASMTVDKPGVRPALIDATLAAELDELLRFRHLFRNLYVLDLDARRIAALLECVGRVHSALTASLDAFDRFLGALESSTVERDLTTRSHST